MFTVPAIGADFEREFSMSGRIITKHHNRLSPHIIRDLMQYKRWGARREDVVQTRSAQDKPTEIDSADTSARRRRPAENEKNLSR